MVSCNTSGILDGSVTRGNRGLTGEGQGLDDADDVLAEGHALERLYRLFAIGFLRHQHEGIAPLLTAADVLVIEDGQGSNFRRRSFSVVSSARFPT